MRFKLAALALVYLGSAVGGESDHGPSFREYSIPTGRGPRFVAVADINHDGRADIIVANDDESVSVLLGDGKGQFRNAPDSPVPAGHLPNDVAVADMNHDGNPDLVIANHQSPYLTILLGDGRGGFRAAPGSPFDVHSNPHPHGVVAAAFSGKGSMDVATDSWGSNQIELLQGDGKGGLLMPGRFFHVGRRPYERLRSADFNKDGHPDLVTTNLDDDTVTILLGDGAGGFREAGGSPFGAGPKPWEVAIDDFNHDGNPDLAIIPYERDVPDKSQVAVTLLLGDGKGGFKPAPPLLLRGCQGPNSIATGDINGDGYRDIVVSCAESANLMLFMGSRNGEFVRFEHTTAGGWGSVAVADLNADGKDDLIHANDGKGSVTIYFSR